MRVPKSLVFGAVAVVVLAACAPKPPPPVMPEPVYDKYGNAVVSGQCRDGSQSYATGSAYSNLPICEGSCAAGYTTNAAFNQCVPVDRGDDQPNGGQRQPTNTQP